MTDKQFKIAFTSAGAWFIALYAKVVMSRIDELNFNKEFKKQFITSIYNDGNGPDKVENGTNVRVNSLMRIINSKRLDEALRKIVCSENVRRYFKEAVETAEELLGET
jgi:hypothetical protein